MMVNSSPPSRATIASPTLAPRRAATARSSSSPTGWPSVSLTALKLSRSTQSKASAAAAPLGLLELEVEMLAEEGAVGQAGQAVVEGELGDPPLALGDAGRHPVEALRQPADLVAWSRP